MKRPHLQFTRMTHEQVATFRRLWYSVYAHELARLLLEQSSIWL